MRANLVRHERRQVTIDRLAFGELGAPLGGGDVLGGVGEPRGLLGIQRARAKVQAGDQRTVHQQVGVAPDRTGEMRVAGQREAEMTDVVRAVGGLRLAAQHNLIDQLRLLGAGDAAQYPVKVARMQLVARRQADADTAEERAQAGKLLLRWWRMDAIHRGLTQALQFFRRRDIGQHHELLDQAMTVQAGAR